MPQRAPIEHKAWLLASLVAGISFWLAKDASLVLPLKMAWKGAGVALLAGYAVANDRNSAARAIALVMALGALGDVLIEWKLEAGAAAFLVGHLCAMALYFRNWRPKITFSQRLLASLVVPAAMFIAGLCAPAGQRIPVLVYAFCVSGMAASAWTSRFPRYRTGIGAMWVPGPRPGFDGLGAGARPEAATGAGTKRSRDRALTVSATGEGAPAAPSGFAPSSHGGGRHFGGMECRWGARGASACGSWRPAGGGRLGRR